MIEFWTAQGSTVPVAPVYYDAGLVGLSVLIAVLGGIASLQMVGIARHPDQFGPTLSTAARWVSAIVLGGSVWCMHFIGMLATDICQPVRYDPWLTAASVLPSLLASAIGLRVFIERGHRRSTVVTAGVFLGAGIGAMHYTGMAAMRMQSALAYDPVWFAASIAVAIGLAIAGLAARQLLAQYTTWPRWLIVGVSGALLGLAISGMHYTAMESAVFIGELDTPFLRGSNRNMELAAIIAGITMAMFGCAWGLLGIATYQHLAQRFREREALLQDILDHIPNAIIRLSIRGDDYHRVLASKSLESLLGRSAKSYQSGQWSLFEAIDSSDMAAAHQLLQTTIDHQGSRSATVRMRTVDGHLRWVDIATHAHRAPNGQTLLDLYLTDVTAQHRARREQAELIQAIDRLIGRAMLSTDGYFLEVNQPLAQTLGYSPEELIGQPHRMVWDAHQDPHSMEQFWDDLRRGQALSGEFVRRAKDGSVRHLVGWYQPLVDPDTANVRAVMKLAIDRTERARFMQELVQTEAQLRSALESRSAFFANVSHEIRTPMNAIVGYAQLLADTLPEGETRQQARVIVESSRSLLRILNDLLDAAKLERGEFSIVEAPFRIDTMAHGLVSQFGALASAKGLDLRLDIQEHMPTRWLGDGDRIRQMLANLLGNAIKFTPSGYVCLRVETDAAARLVLHVQDSGIGIPADRQQAIFEPFVQADSGTARRYGGTGLGMSIVKGLCERMNGHIELQSQPGQGTRISLYLPLKALADDPQPAPPPPDAVAQTPTVQRRLRLLCADDVEQNRDLAHTLLSRAGHTACVLASGEELLRQYQASPHAWDAVLLDLHMPDMDGPQTCRLLRAFEREQGLPPIPVLALSASVMETDRRNAQASGMDGFLEKPIDMHALQQALARISQHARAGADAPRSSEAPDSAMACTAATVADAERGAALWGADWLQQVRRWVRQLEPDWPQRHQWDAAQWHRIAGVAANLALPALAQAAREAQERAHLGQPVDLTVVDPAWQGVREWLAEQPDAPHEAPAPPHALPALDRPACLSLLDKLEHGLRKGQIDDDVLDTLGAQTHSVHARALRQACEDFDFEAALQSIARWRAELTATGVTP